MTDWAAMREPALQPCPFCGGVAYFTESVNGSRMVYVGCGTCDIVFKAQKQQFGQDETLTNLKAAWNKRTALDEIERLQRENGELHAAINTDGSLTEHSEFVMFAQDGAHALTIEREWRALIKERDELRAALQLATDNLDSAYYYDMKEQLQSLLDKGPI